MKRMIAAILTATTMTLASCTATTATDPNTSAAPGTDAVAVPAPTPTGSTTPDPVKSWLFGTTSTSSSPTSAAATVTATSSTATSIAVTGDVYDAIPVTIPATITGVGLKAANAAIPVWRNAVRLYDESMQNPDDDWKAKIRKYVADPAAITQLSLVSALAQDGMHQIGDTSFDAKVIVATVNNVQIRACVDVTRLDVVNADGTSITGGSARRFLWEYNIDFYPNEVSHWLLNLVTKPMPTKPC